MLGKFPARLVFSPHTVTDEDECDDVGHIHASEIMDAEYDETTPTAVAKSQTHLSTVQQEQLETVLNRNKVWFDCKFGHCVHHRVGDHLYLKGSTAAFSFPAYYWHRAW